MKRRILTVFMAGIMTILVSMTSLAAGWQWLDGNGDGIAESYYVNDDGSVLKDTTTPDGYTVNADGAWVVNGVVQTKQVGAGTGSTNNAGTGTEQDLTGDLAIQHTGDRYTYDICWRYDQFDDGTRNSIGISNFYEREENYINSQKSVGVTPGTTYPNDMNTNYKETGKWVVDNSHANATSGESNIRFKLSDGTYAGEGWHRILMPSGMTKRDYFFSPNGYLVRNARILSDKRTVYISVNPDGTWLDGNYEYVK